MTGHLEIRLCGQLEVWFDGVRQLLRDRCAAPLAYLLVHRDETISRRELAALFWPDADDEAALANLRRRLHELRHTIPSSSESRFVVTPTTVRWESHANATIDISEFDRAIDERRFLDAVQQYRGEFLEGHLEEWIVVERDRLRSRFITACFEAAFIARRDRDFETALACVDRIVEADAWREDALRLSMTLHRDSGDRSAALDSYERFAARLSAGMGIEPMPDTRALRDIIAKEADPVVSARTPFVGRANELETLKAISTAAARGNGTTMFISGSAGVGKSRLASELAMSFSAQGGRTLLGQTSDPESTPYEPIVGALRRGAALIAGSGIEDIWLSILAELVKELRDIRGDLAPPAQMDPLPARERLHEAIVHAVRHLARSRPLLIVLEDLQCAQSATLDSVEALSRRIGALPVFLVLTYRADEAAAERHLNPMRRRLQGQRRANAMILPPITSQDVEEMVRKTPLLADAPRDLADTVFTLSEGNPLFANQLFQIYLEAGRLPDERAAARSIAQTILFRIGSLDEDSRLLVEVAAIQGRSFGAAVTRRAVGWETGRFFDAVGHLLDRAIVRDCGYAPLTYEFAHALIAAVVYDVTPDDARAAHHRSTAEAMIAESVSDHSSLASIARHLKLGGERQRAANAYAQAASSALDIYARDEAKGYAREGLMLAVDPAERFALLAQLVRAQEGGVSLADWKREVDEMSLAASALGDSERFAALASKERYYSQVADRESQRGVIDRMLELSRASGSDTFRCVTLCALGRLQIALGKLHDSADSLRQAVELARKTRDDRSGATAGDHLAQVLIRIGPWDEVRREIESLGSASGPGDALTRRRRLLHAQSTLAVTNEDTILAKQCGPEMLAFGRETGDLLAEVRGHILLAFAAQHHGDAREVREHYRESIDLSERLGLLQGMATSLINYGTFEAFLGRLDPAVELYDRALRIGEQIGSQTILAFALSNLADAYVEMGNAERALAIAVMAHERALPIGERRLVAASTMSLGSATFASGNHILGLDLMKKALGDRRDLGSAYPLTDDLCTFALALFDAERPIEGHAVALELQVLFETYPERIKQPTRLCWTLARDAQAMGEHERARTYVDRGRTFLKDDLVRINDADAEVSLRKLSFNRSLLDWPTPSRS